VLVVGGVDGLAAGQRRSRRKRGRARDADPKPPSPEVPITRLTVIRSGALDGEAEAEAWLGRLAGDPESADDFVEEGAGIVNRALHAHRLATQDPHGSGVSPSYALAIRVGFGSGDDLADGRWSEAVDVPAAPGPRNRAEALRPQERMAATLGRREAPAACETLVLRARGDLDAARTREAALQVRVGLEALLAEVAAADSGASGLSGAAAALADDQVERQAADLVALRERRSATGEAANEALAGELSEARAGEVAETLRICERVIRRRRILAG